MVYWTYQNEVIEEARHNLMILKRELQYKPSDMIEINYEETNV